MNRPSPRSRAFLAAATVGVLVTGGLTLVGSGGTAALIPSGAKVAKRPVVAPNHIRAVRPKGIISGSSAVEVATAWLAQNSKILRGTDVASLKTLSVTKSPAAGQRIVRLQEVHSGTPVLGGQAVIAIDAQNRVVAGSAETLSGRVPSAAPGISAGQAQSKAVAALSKRATTRAHVTGAPTLAFFDPRILGGPGLQRASLVWQVPVAREGKDLISRMVYIDAQRGFPVASIDRLEAGLNRRVCDAASTSNRVPCGTSTPVRVEGGAAVTGGAASDANHAYDYAGSTYNFYNTILGRDGIDGAGMRIDSTVRYCPDSTQCPFANAYWDGSQMIYGAGYSAADDVVAHELTHGITDYTSGLFYYFQSGAINEGLSDVFGELVDQWNGQGNDTSGVKWLIGEDLAGYSGGLRNMADPTKFGDPDKTSSANYTADAAVADSGGVHTNSGVTNKAAYLITDGATFNGQSITGIGLTKSAHVWYQAELLLRSGSDYQDLGTALSQGCQSLVAGATVTSNDCQQVDKAVVATEMPQTPTNAATPKATLCETGTPSNSYFDNFDGSHSWVKAATAGSNHWLYGSEDPASGGYAKSGTDNLWGDDSAVRADTSITMGSSVRVPTGGKLYFDHAYGFETDTDGHVGNYDGGVIEYSTNNGSTWHDAGSLITTNGYAGTISTATGTDNPLGGRSAFVGDSRGYISSRLDLSSLAGQDVKFRFRLGSDSGTSDYGWYVDNFRVYTCGSVDTTPPETTLDAGGTDPAPSNGQTVSYANPSFSFSSSEASSTFECRIDGGAWSGCNSPKAYTALSDGPHVFDVRATDAAANTDLTPASRTFTIDSTGPETSLDAVPASRGSATSVSFRFASPDSGATFDCRLGSASFTACSSPKAYSGLTDGSYTFQVRAVDAVGNADSSPATYGFVIDTAAPDTTMATPPAAYINTKSITLNFAASEGGASFQCQMDTTAVWTACSSPKVYAGLSEGPHTFRARALDSLLNIDQTPVSASFMVDTIAPNTKITTAPTLTKLTKPTFVFSTTPTADAWAYICAIDTGVWAPCTTPWKPLVALKKGSHTFKVKAVDRAANYDPTAATKTFRVY